jgi:hypothetical protein
MLLRPSFAMARIWASNSLNRLTPASSLLDLDTTSASPIDQHSLVQDAIAPPEM